MSNPRSQIILTFLLLWIFAGMSFTRGFASASEGDSVRQVRHDSMYIRDYTHLLTMRFFILYQESKLIYKDQDLGDIVFKPNQVYKVGIAGFYHWFGLGLSYYSPLALKKSSTYGKTVAYEIRINLYSKMFMVEGYAQWLKGFYVSNFSTPDGGFYTNPSLRLLSVGASGYYIMNSRRFSIRAAYIQTEQQLKSAGSFMTRLSFSYGNIKTDSGLIPPQLLHDRGFDSLLNLERGSYYLAGFAPGYGYTVVFLKNFYVNADAFLGFGWSFLSGRNTTGEEARTNGFALQFNPRLAAGYNSGKWYIGGSAVMGIWQFSALSDYSLLYDTPQFRFWVGTRFDLHKKKNKKK
jgi:hypothetical protein